MRDIKAITFDLDDTLWPIAPVIARAERRVHDWLQANFPAVAERWSMDELRALREQVAREHPELRFDFSALRRATLRRAMQPLGMGERDVERAFQVFFAARNRVELYADVPRALDSLRGRFRLASITNGNASVEAVGLSGYFEVSVSARDAGVAKPEPGIFAHAVERLGLEPHQVVHVGDDLELDVVGALGAGLNAVWVNRAREPIDAGATPTVASLDELPGLLVNREQRTDDRGQ